MSGGEVNWRAAVAGYKADTRRAVVQIIDTLVPLAVAFYATYRALAWSPWLALLLALPTAGLLVRTFIIMHDCGHGSFLPSRRGNDVMGFITGVLTATPFDYWRHEHAIHHASAGDLDRRGHGDVTTLTVEEYLALDRWGRLRYRLYRHPLVLLGLGPLYMLVLQRFPVRNASSGSARGASIWTTNLALAVCVTALAFVVGVQTVMWVYLPAAYLAAGAGVALFFVQHQYEDAYWRRHAQWDYAVSAIDGSSHLALSPVLRWFTGSIGVHHIHHLAPKVPNYLLQRCQDEHPELQAARVLTLRSAVPCFRLALWDEDAQRMVGFRQISQRL
jgi:acyl-lipid omega-6 desaturase (Delta-12 desaturase)